MTADFNGNAAARVCPDILHTHVHMYTPTLIKSLLPEECVCVRMRALRRGACIYNFMGTKCLYKHRKHQQFWPVV